MDYDDAVTKTQTSLAVILLGLVMGVVAIGGIGLYLEPMIDDAHTAEMLRWAAIALALAEFSAAFFIYTRIGSRIQQQEGWETRLAAVRGRVIVAAAMLEGAALFAGVVIILTGPSWHVIPGFALFFIGLGVIVPTRANIVRAVGKPDGRSADRYV